MKGSFLALSFMQKRVMHNICPYFFASFQPPSLPLSTPVHFLLNNPLPLSVWTLSCKTNKELQKLWRNDNSLENTYILYLFLVCLSSFQYLAQEDDDKLTLKFPLLSCRDDTEKDVHFQLSPLPPPIQQGGKMF